MKHSAPSIISRFWRLRKTYPVNCYATSKGWEATIHLPPFGLTAANGKATTQSAAMLAAMEEMERMEKK